MDKFSKIISNYAGLRFEDTQNISSPDNLWSEADMKQFLYVVNEEQNWSKALSIILQDPSIEVLLDQNYLKQTVSDPTYNLLDTIKKYSGLNVTQKIQAESSDTKGQTPTGPSAPAPNTAQPLAVRTPAAQGQQTPSIPKNDINIINGALSSITSVGEKISDIASIDKLNLLLNNLNKAFNTKYDNINKGFEKLGKLAEKQNWEETLSNMTKGMVSNAGKTANEKYISMFDNTINTYKIVLEGGFTGPIYSTLSRMTKKFLWPMVNIIGSLFATALFMPVRIIMSAIDLIKKHKDFIIKLLFPIGSMGVMIISPGKEGVPQGPEMQKQLSAMIDFVMDLGEKFMYIIGLKQMAGQIIGIGK